jgi:hypothetical protein
MKLYTTKLLGQSPITSTTIGGASIYFRVTVDSRLAHTQSNRNGDARLAGVIINQLREGKLVTHAQPPISAISSGFDK